MFGFTKDELRILKKLNTPQKIQNYLQILGQNHCSAGDTLMSPRRVLREQKAHCIEGALLAAAAFWVNGQLPLLLDLRANQHDLDHVVALFRGRGFWGAVSKTNHPVLRYREPVYKTIRELALSYFHEYTTDDGRKTLREYSRPFNIKNWPVDSAGNRWTTSENDLWDLADALDDSPHFAIIDKAQIRTLRRADPIERAAGKMVEWPKKGRRMLY